MGGSNSTLNNDVVTLKSQMNTLQNQLSNYSQVATAALNPSSQVTSQLAANIDYPKLTAQLLNSSNVTSLTDALSKSNPFIQALVPPLATTGNVQGVIKDTIAGNGNFLTSVKNVIIADDKAKLTLKGDKGDPGNIGDYGALRANLFGPPLTKADGKKADHAITLWCADGDFCQLPPGSKGFTTADASGNLVINNKGLTIGNWTIYDGGDGLYFKKGNNTVARFSDDWDKFNVYQNSDGKKPYYYYNKNGDFGACVGDTCDNVMRTSKQYKLRLNNPRDAKWNDYNYLTMSEWWTQYGDGKYMATGWGRGNNNPSNINFEQSQ